MLEQQNYLGAQSLVLYHLRHMYPLVAQVLLFADQFINNTYVASNLYGCVSDIIWIQKHIRRVIAFVSMLARLDTNLN